MSLFKWFSGSSSHTGKGDDSGGSDRGSRSLPAVVRPLRSSSSRPAADAGPRSEERKIKRHARREQLYAAVRESMTHCGVLSASYKFKVLSLDQGGDEFLVMMDVDQSLGSQPGKLVDIENKIIHNAKARFEILVTAIYWRTDTRSAVGRRKEADPTSAHTGDSARQQPPKTPSRYEPVLDDEVAAFKQALAAASARGPAAIDGAGKTRSGPHSYTLLTGFEDTEMPESPTAPVLSNTQYGDLA